MTVQTQKFALNYNFANLSALNLTTSHDLEELANQHIDAIIQAFNIVKLNFDDWRSEYNATKPTNERIYLTPYLRTVEGARRNIYIVWVRICSESYLGNLNAGGPWKPREIKRNGKLHYNLQTLKSNLCSYNRDCIKYIMDAEHCMVYLREQTALVSSLFETSRSIKPSGYGLIAAKHKLNQLTDDELLEFEKLEDEMLFLKGRKDPLSLSKKLTKIQFRQN